MLLPNIVLYDYQNSRRGECAKIFLQDYTGYLQVDGYSGYEQTTATLAGCWAHARRKFAEVYKMQSQRNTGKAYWALNHIQKLYRIEKEIKEYTPDEKQRVRQEQSAPLLAQYKTWLEQTIPQVPPQSALGKALAYSHKQWPKLTQYIHHGHLNIDNNRAERAIKPFVIGRKNWLFSNTQTGAQASAVLYSVIETAKANGLIPFDYVLHCLTELPKPTTDIESLMPWKVKLPESFKV